MQKFEWRTKWFTKLDCNDCETDVNIFLASSHRIIVPYCLFATCPLFIQHKSGQAGYHLSHKVWSHYVNLGAYVSLQQRLNFDVYSAPSIHRFAQCINLRKVKPQCWKHLVSKPRNTQQATTLPLDLFVTIFLIIYPAFSPLYKRLNKVFWSPL